MIIIGTGIDMVEIARVRAARHFLRLAEYVLTPREIIEMGISRDAAQFLASRFAAKEAVIKASPAVVTYQEIEIVKEGVKPVARVAGGEFLISISHTFEHTIASALAINI